jgi:hypothetical protein
MFGTRQRNDLCRAASPAKPLPCNDGESHGKETFAVNGIVVRHRTAKPLLCI